MVALRIVVNRPEAPFVGMLLLAGLAWSLAAGAQTPAATAPASPATPAAAPAQQTTEVLAAFRGVSHEEILERRARDDASLVVLDVRTPEEFAKGHVPGARNIPHDQLPQRLAELADAAGREIVVYCRSGRRSAIALTSLRERGFGRLSHLQGDWIGWEAAQRPIEQPAGELTASAPQE